MEAFSHKLNACFESWLGPRGEFGCRLEFWVSSRGSVACCKSQPRNFHRLLLDVQRAVHLRRMAASISGHGATVPRRCCGGCCLI